MAEFQEPFLVSISLRNLHDSQSVEHRAFPLVIGLSIPSLAARFSFLKLARGWSPVACRSKNRGNAGRKTNQGTQP